MTAISLIFFPTVHSEWLMWSGDLTICEVGDIGRQRGVADVMIGHMEIYVKLCFRCFQESHKASCEGRHKDGQHAKVQNIPEMHDVLAWTIRPNFFTL